MIDDFEAKKALLGKIKQSLKNEVESRDLSTKEKNRLWNQIGLLGSISEDLSRLKLVANGRFFDELRCFRNATDTNALRELMHGPEAATRALQ